MDAPLDEKGLEAAKEAFNEAVNNPRMVPCPKCDGKGYHHGFGEDGASPDWCLACGGGQYDLVPGEEDRALAEAIRAYLSAVALPDELDVVDNLRSDAAQLLRMSKATKFGEDLSVRVKKPDLLISNMIAAADALSQAHSTIAALRAERDEARKIVRDIHWMAVRYADGRQSYAVGMCADALRKAYDAGWLTYSGGHPHHDLDPQYPRDGSKPEYRSVEERAETAEAQVQRLTEEKEALDRHNQALLDKVSSENCACAYDHPDDVCLGHSPKLKAAEARIKALEEALGNLRCPRPCNHRPDEFDAKDCVAAGECGCGAAILSGDLNAPS